MKLINVRCQWLIPLTQVTATMGLAVDSSEEAQFKIARTGRFLRDRRHIAPWATPSPASSPALQALAGRNVQPGCAADPQALGGGIDTGEDLSFDDICCSSRR
jgi:hypothetical protein